MKTTATFRLFGDSGRRADIVTTRLSITPSRSFEFGDPIGSRSSAVHKHSGWFLTSSDEIEDGVELDAHLLRLLHVLEPVEKELWDLVRDGYRANWFCFVASNPAEHAVELSRDLLGRLLRLPGDLWLDACGDDTPLAPSPYAEQTGDNARLAARDLGEGVEHLRGPTPDP